MSELSEVAAYVAGLSRDLSGVTAVRSAWDDFGLEVEFVLVQDQRTVVIAALNELPLQPRPSTIAERHLIAEPHRGEVSVDDSVSLKIAECSEGLLALGLQGRLSDEHLDSIRSISATLRQSIDAMPQPDPAQREISGCSGSASNEFTPDPIAVLDSQRDVMLVIDEDLVIRYCNHAVLTVFGWRPSELIGRVGTTLVHPDDLLATMHAIARLRNAEQIYRLRLRLCNAADAWVAVSITAIDQSNNPAIRGLVVSVRPSNYETQNSRALHELQHQAHYDQVTGLLSRRALQDGMHAHRWRMADTVADADPIVFCVIDIDDFKTINDIHGNASGDQVLRAAATRLQAFTSDNDLLARIGSDEFVLVLTDRNRTANATLTAQRIRLALSEPYEVGGNLLSVTVSVGIATRPHDQVDFEEILRDASLALVAAKTAGPDQAVEFDTNLADAAARSQRQQAMVRDALSHGRLVMHFQPIVNLDGTIVGFEALARCVDADGQTHLPADFIPAISSSSLMVELDRQGFGQACQLAGSLSRSWPTLNLFVSCNFSASTIAQSDFVEQILTTMVKHGTAPQDLSIEITESIAFEASTRSIDGLRELRDAGVGLSLDDFGTGYSSLSHLRDLPLTTVKIDRTFIDNLHKPGPEQTITRAITELARSLGFNVIAEGIETQEQQDTARLMGINLLQGWLFDKALTSSQARERLNTPRAP